MTALARHSRRYLLLWLVLLSSLNTAQAAYLDAGRDFAAIPATQPLPSMGAGLAPAVFRFLGPAPDPLRHAHNPGHAVPQGDDRWRRVERDNTAPSDRTVAWVF